MQNSRDLSIWRSLAVAFGDGLAFGVGMKLTQKGARQEDAPELPPAPGVPTDRNVLEAVVNALEARLNEHTAHVERRLADMESRIALDLGALRQQAEAFERRAGQGEAALREEVAADTRAFAYAVGVRMEKDLTAVRDEMVSLNREFAQSVSHIVAEQVAAGTANLESRVAPRLESIEAEGREAAMRLERAVLELREELPHAASRNASAAVEDKLTPIRVDLADLRSKAGATDANMLEFILAMGQMCRQASERAATVSPHEAGTAPAEDPHEEAPPPATAAQAPDPPPAPAPPAEPDLPVPEFKQAKGTSGLWRVPLVSSLVLAAGGAIVMHFL